MEKIKIKNLINRSNDSENFVYQIFDRMSAEFQTSALGDDGFWNAFSSFYYGHSGNKWLGGEGYSELDGVSLVDDDDNDVSLTLTDREDTGVIDSWSSFSNNLGGSLCYHFAYKWISAFNTLEKNYQADIDEDEKYTETLTNNLKDEKNYGKTNETRRGSNISSTDSVTTTESTTPYNSSTFQAINKTTTTSDTNTTSEADANITNSADSGSDTTVHTGTRTREVVRTGGADKWRRGQEYLSLLSHDIFEMMARDIDSVVTLPFYSVK